MTESTFLENLLDRAQVEWNTLGELAENRDSKRKPITSSSREPGKIPYYGASGIVDYVKGYIFDGEYLLVSEDGANLIARNTPCLLYTSPSPRDRQKSRMPSSA